MESFMRNKLSANTTELYLCKTQLEAPLFLPAILVGH